MQKRLLYYVIVGLVRWIKCLQYSYLKIVEIKYEHSICDLYLCHANILTSYLCKPEHTMSVLMKKAANESYRRIAWGKLSAIGNVFITKREVSTHEAIKRVLSLPLRTSNIGVIYIPNAQKKKKEIEPKCWKIYRY